VSYLVFVLNLPEQESNGSDRERSHTYLVKPPIERKEVEVRERSYSPTQQEAVWLGG
jgi:hypothetical protein